MPDIDMVLCEMEHEHRMMRARNERLEQEIEQLHQSFVNFLMEQHEKSKGQHNHFACAAVVYKERFCK